MQPTSTVIKGVVIALIMIISSIAIYFSGVDLNSPVKWLSYCILVAGIIISVLQYGKQIDYNATFGNYFAHGFKVAAAITVLMVIYMIVFIYIFPDFKEKALEEARKAMDAKNNISEEQKTTALEMTKKLFTVFVVGGTLLSTIIIGVIGALIGAAVAKKNPRPLDENQIGV